MRARCLRLDGVEPGSMRTLHCFLLLSQNALSMFASPNGGRARARENSTMCLITAFVQIHLSSHSLPPKRGAFFPTIRIFPHLPRATMCRTFASRTRSNGAERRATLSRYDKQYVYKLSIAFRSCSDDSAMAKTVIFVGFIRQSLESPFFRLQISCAHPFEQWNQLLLSHCTYFFL